MLWMAPYILILPFAHPFDPAGTPTPHLGHPPFSFEGCTAASFSGAAFGGWELP